MDSPPIACTLGAADLVDRGAAWRALTDGWLTRRALTDDGVNLSFRADPGVAATARELARLEAECCSWMRIEVAVAAEVTMDVSGTTPDAVQAIQQLFMG